MGSPGGAVVCGNGVLEPGEQCDDGNTEDGDGCSSTCKLESPLACDTNLCDHGDCDTRARFKVLNCILQSPVCQGESLPGSVTKRIARTRDVLSQASEMDKPRHGRSLVSQWIRILKNTGKLVIGRHKHRLSRQCVGELVQVLVEARHQCPSWRGSF